MLRLRPFEPRDAAAIVSWCRDEYAFRQWSADRFDHYPLTAEDLIAHYRAQENADFFPMTAFDETGVVGHLILRFTDPEKTALRFGFVIVDPARRGQGNGKELLRLALRMAFDVLRAKTVSLGVFANNPAAYHCYKAAGFADVPLDQPEYYHVLGEDWPCLELRYPTKEGQP